MEALKCGLRVLVLNFTPDIPQSEIAARNFYDRAKFGAKNWAKNWAKFWANFLGHFRASCAVLPKFPSQFITPCLVTALVVEISKFHLRELLGLGAPNQLSTIACNSMLGGRFGYFFPARGGGKGESEAPGGGGGFGVLLEIPGGGEVLQDRRG